MVEQYENLFSKLREIQVTHSKRKTFMNVSGYPHYENVVSNILSFLFDDSEEHGFSDLWLNALLSTVGERETRNITVEREVVTDKGNRIDLLVTSDDYIICIENKIFSDVHNDLADYKTTAEKRIDSHSKKLICIVLSLTPAEYKAKDIFKNVIYDQLFSEVRSSIGDYIENCNNTWFLYTKDFIATIEALNGGNMINTEFEKLCREYSSDIRSFEKNKKDYINAIKDETTQLSSLLQTKLDALDNDFAFTGLKATTYCSPAEMRTSVYIDFYLNSKGKKGIAIETSRDAWGWHIALISRSSQLELMRKICSEREIPHPAEETDHEHKNPFYEGQHIIKTFNTSISLEKVSEEIMICVNELAPIFKNYFNK